jgi:phytoene/squalene synthetase
MDDRASRCHDGIGQEGVGAVEVVPRLTAGALPLVVGYLPVPLRAPVAGIGGYAAALAAAAVGPSGRGELDRVRLGLQRMSAGLWPGHPLLDRLLPTVRAYALPIEVLDGMLADSRYALRGCRTFDQLVACCDRVAGPPGELALRVLGAGSAEQLALCRYVCTGSALLGRVVMAATDWQTNRRLLPAVELDRFGMTGDDGAAVPAWRRAGVLELQAERARALLESGAPLVATLRGRRRMAVGAHLAYCRAVLASLERDRYRPSAWREPTTVMVGRQWVRSLIRHPG